MDQTVAMVRERSVLTDGSCYSGTGAGRCVGRPGEEGKLRVASVSAALASRPGPKLTLRTVEQDFRSRSNVLATRTRPASMGQRVPPASARIPTGLYDGTTINAFASQLPAAGG